MSTALTETGQEPRGTLQWYLEQPAYKNRFNAMLRDRAPQFMSSILSLAASPNFKGVEPRSILAAAAVAATLNLPIDRNLGFAWIVPYNDNKAGTKIAQFQMAAKGYIQLAQRTAQYKRMNARVINEEAFKGWDSIGEAIIDWGKIDESQPAVGYTFGFELVNGFLKVEYWTVAKVKKHAERYSQNHKGHINKGYPQGRDCRWCTDFDAMALKTVISNTLRKWGILSIEMQFAVNRDQSVSSDLDTAIDIEATPSYPDSPNGTEEAAEGEGEPETAPEPEVKTSKADQMASKLASAPIAESSTSNEEAKSDPEGSDEEVEIDEASYKQLIGSLREKLEVRGVASKAQFDIIEHAAGVRAVGKIPTNKLPAVAKALQEELDKYK